MHLTQKKHDDEEDDEKLRVSILLPSCFPNHPSSLPPPHSPLPPPFPFPITTLLPFVSNMLSSSSNSNQPPSLPRQPSIYTLTLEEIQNALSNDPGKNFGSMNMEEFMKNVWTAEESHAMVAALNSGSSVQNKALLPQSSSQRPNGLSLPPDLSRKTVEDVWKEIQPHPSQQHALDRQRLHQQQSKQASFGEMTLEDFLVRAGVGRDDLDTTARMTDGSAPMTLYAPVPIGNASPSMDALQRDWMSYATTQHRGNPHQMMQQTEGTAAAAAAATKMGLSSPSAATKMGLSSPSETLMLSVGNPLYDRMSDSVGLGPDSLTNSLALSPAATDYSIHARKRFSSEAVYEKTMERRQKRMIKNRESAARSRARKQAYTVELEAEVAELKKENARLKQQQALENRHSETWDLRKPKVVLRRTQSC